MQNERLKDNHIRERLKKLISWLKEMIRTKLHLKTKNLPYYITILLSLVIFIVGLKVFIELADELAENQLENFDRDVSAWIQSYRSDAFTPVLRIITELGDRYAYATLIIALGLFFWFRYKHWRSTLQIVGVLFLSTTSNIIVKQIVNRARPGNEHLVFVDTLSFPSGHSMSAMAFYGTLIYLCLNARLNIIMRLIITILLGTIIVAVGISRIYLGVHYPSDVLAGYAGGLIWVTLSAILLNTIDLWQNRQLSEEAV